MARPILQRGNAPVSAGPARRQAAPGLTVQQPILSEAPRENSFGALASALGVAADEAIKRSAASVEEDAQWRLENATAAAQAAGVSGDAFDAVGEEYKKEPERFLRIVQDTYNTARAGRETLEWSTDTRVEFATYRRENPDMTDEEITDFFASKREAFFAPDENGDTPFGDNPKQRAAILEQMLRAEETAKLETLPDAIANVTQAAVEETNVMWAQTFGTQPVPKDGSQYVALIGMYEAQKLPPDVIAEQVVAMGLSMAGASGDTAWLDTIPAKFALRDPVTIQKMTVARTQIDVRKERERMKALEGEQISLLEEYDRIAKDGGYLTEEQKARALAIGVSPSRIAGFQGSADAALKKIEDDAKEDAKDAAEAAALSITLLENPALVGSVSKIEKGYNDRVREAQSAGNGELAMQWINKAYDNGYIPTTARLRMNKVPTQWGAADGEGFQRWYRSVKTVYERSPTAYGTLGEDARIHFEAMAALKDTSDYSDKELFNKLRGRDVALGKERSTTNFGKDLIANVVGKDAGLPARKIMRGLIERIGAFSELSDEEVTELATKAYDGNYFTDGGRVYSRSIVPDEDSLEFLQRQASAMLAKSSGTRKALKVDYDDIVVSHGNNADSVQFRDRGTGALLITLSSQSIDKLYKSDKTERRKREGKRAAGMTPAALGPKARQAYRDAINLKK